MKHMGSRLWRELVRIRTRLLLVNLFVVAVPLLGVSFARFYEKEMLRSLEADMVHQAALVGAMTEDRPVEQWSKLGTSLAHAARRTRTRIRLLDASGHVLCDSHANGPPEGPEHDVSSWPGRGYVSKVSRSARDIEPRSMAGSGDPLLQGLTRSKRPSDLSGRSEVRAAIAGRYGAATRFWSNRDRLYLFAALPIRHDHHVTGVAYVTRSTNPVRASLYRLRTRLFVILVLSLTATGVLSLFLARTISRPLRQLIGGARRISAGDRSASLDLGRRDEIGDLSRAFDDMTRKLDERATDVSKLAANISHEFKSPLTSLRGAAELLLDGAADDPDDRAHFLNNMLDDTKRLDRLVSRLLELARYEADPAPDGVVDLETLTRQSAERSSQTGPRTVTVRYDARHTQIVGKQQHLASVLDNLLDNAQQHAADDSVIEVTVADSPDGFVVVRVHNDGPPISEANLNKIWTRFFTTRSDRGGTGLGLSIVASIVRAHGGSVWVKSLPGEGTTFAVQLPVARRN